MESIKPQIRQVDENEVLIKDNAAWLYFTHPYRLFRVETREDVLPALHEIERLVQEKDWYAAGFLSYEAASAFDPALQTHASFFGQDARTGPDDPPPLRPEFPYLWFGLYPSPRFVSLPEPAGARGSLNWKASTCRDAYNAAIGKIKQQIAEGKTYQVNYTLRLESEFTGSAWDFFLHLAQHQNRHAAYIDTGRHVICSASPELFFQLEGNTIRCRPMKGTTARGRTMVEDREQSEWLKNSEKNRAENVMIVDMIRNDLGRIAEIGSVAVPQLFETERYPTLWQMTSTVTARTRASLADIFAALFPSASITGAPKVSTMRIIAELESTPRKIYTGTVGYMTPERKAKFNVAIRTALIDREHTKIEYGVGGGVVWDSNSTDEYAEALLKARVLTQQPHSFSLLETMLWTAEEGFYLHEKHMARLLDSADFFDIPLKKEHLEEYLDGISSRFRTAQRVRLLLDQMGELTFSASPFFAPEDQGPLRVCLAKAPVNSSDVFLFHKTTRREVYESARWGTEGVDDVLLYNEKGELTEFTIGNLVVEWKGQLLTPPVACGVLPGTFRASLLEAGQVVEQILPVEQLADCSRIFRVNSIRRWQIAELRP